MKAYFLAGPVLAITLNVATAAPQSRPNVLFIATDDLRTGVGCYGDPIAKTPNIDSLAARGVKFERAYIQQALCNPSRSSIMTGLRPDSLKVWDLNVHFRETVPDVITLPQYFRQNGYFTQNIGKIYHNWRTKIQGDPESWSVPAFMHFANHASDVPQIDGGTASENLSLVRGTERRDVPDEAYFDGRVAAASIEALSMLSRESQPFFLAVGFWKPHLPFNPPKRYWDLYREDDIPEISNPNPRAGVPSLAGHEAHEGMADTIQDPKAHRVLRHGYYAATSFVDAQIGKVLDALDKLGLADNTIVVLWSDHGFHLGEHGLWGKTSNYELDARVPLIIAGHGYARGASSKALVELLDLYPTLVDLCGLPQRTELQGQSLKPILVDPAQNVKAAAFTQHQRPAYGRTPGEVMGYSMRTDRYRYTEWRDWKSGSVLGLELYDHQIDGTESVNLAGASNMISVQRDLAAQLGLQFAREPLPFQ